MGIGHKSFDYFKNNQEKSYSFFNQKRKFQYSYGGELRKKRSGRGSRPLTTKDPIHLVLKVNRKNIRRGLRSPLGFKICNSIITKYAQKFYVKVEQVSINHDHIHLLVRLSRRSLGINFFRVVTGQIAQTFVNNGFMVTRSHTIKSSSQIYSADSKNKSLISSRSCRVTDTPRSNVIKLKLWKHRPFTRVVKGWKAYQIVQNYILLNEMEALGIIPYQKLRLKGLSSAEWKILRKKRRE